MADKLISKIPDGPLAEKWTKRKSEIRLVSPNNKRKLEIIVVGTGLGGASAAATLGELGYNVKVFCISDSPRRAHSISAQGGINAAKNYDPARMTHYLMDVATLFHKFYNACRVQGEDEALMQARISLCLATRVVLANLLKLLKINAPQSM